MKNMPTKEILKTTALALLDKKARNLKIIKVGDLTIAAEYFVVAGGTSVTQVKSLADEVDRKLSEKGSPPKRSEGARGSNWIALDFVDVIVHIFHEDTRSFYELERLWEDGELIDVDELIK